MATTALDLNYQALAQQGLTYEAYRGLIDRLLEKGQSTGLKQSEALTHYSALNVQRMRRLDKTTRLLPEVTEGLNAISRPQVWLVITEGWCGDAAQIVPVLQHLADASPQVTVRYVLRDEHPALMDAYLTNGGRSIPKVVGLDAHTWEAKGSWGPRPDAAQQMVLDYKALEHRPPYDEFVKDVQKWYAKDRTTSIQHEVLEAAQGWDRA